MAVANDYLSGLREGDKDATTLACQPIVNGNGKLPEDCNGCSNSWLQYNQVHITDCPNDEQKYNEMIIIGAVALIGSGAAFQLEVIVVAGAVWQHSGR